MWVNAVKYTPISHTNHTVFSSVQLSDTWFRLVSINIILLHVCYSKCFFTMPHAIHISCSALTRYIGFCRFTIVYPRCLLLVHVVLDIISRQSSVGRICVSCYSDTIKLNIVHDILNEDTLTIVKTC